MLQALAFYLFASVLIGSALMVISARNPVHSVLFLILGFFNAAGLFVLLGAEFVAMILVIVYVGAVAVLFLFVVMMLDINFADLRRGAMKYLPFGILIGVVLLLELFLVYRTWPAPVAAVREQAVIVQTADEAVAAPALVPTLDAVTGEPVVVPAPVGAAEEAGQPDADDAVKPLTNTEIIGARLYTDYVFAFQVAGLILFVAMIGAIVLTFRRRPDTRRQKISAQTGRRPADAMEVQKVTSGTGI